MPIILSVGEIQEKRADEVSVGETLACMDDRGSMQCAQIVEVSFKQVQSGVGNFIVKGYPIANGIVSSIRVDGDAPELVWDVGYKIYEVCGPLSANLICNVGNLCRDKNIKSTISVLLLFIFIVVCILGLTV